VYNAFHSDNPDRVLPVKPNTIARSIAIGNPSDGIYVNRMRARRRRRGGGDGRGDRRRDSVAGADRGHLHRDGGGVTIGVLAKLARLGRWKGDEVVVAYVTATG